MKTLNLTNLRCPDTIFILKKKIKQINYKNIILIISDDISTKWEIPLFCNFMKYQIIKKKINHIPYKFLIKKIL